ncbi:MAG: rhodanese-like domain-containing protein [Thermodesulfobacteriota bacterium]
MVKTISRQQLKEHIDTGKDLVLVEALPEKYFNEAHLPGAVQIDYTEVNEKAPVLLENKDDMIVVYCASTECQNSSKGANQLDSIGYTNVYEYIEGKQDWIEAGMPVESS